MKHVATFVGVLFLALAAGCSSPPLAPETPAAADPGAPVFDTMEYKIRMVTVVGGLNYPYSFAFLPDGGILLTEMEGKLRLIRDGKLEPKPIAGIPPVVHDKATKGLMDIALHPRFAENHWVYFTYDKAGGKGVTEALARGTFDGKQLSDVKDIFVADAWVTTTGRQNSRITFAPDGTIFMTASAGGNPYLAHAQQLADHAGKVLRLRDDGTVPPDNPFVGQAGKAPEIYTYGHQNIHALTHRPGTNEIWSIEHGDEANILKPGANYGVGLPEGKPIPAGIQVTAPYISWANPDIHPSGILFYTGDKFPKWQGNVFIGGLNKEQVHRVALGSNGAEVQENLFSMIGQWVRDVRQGPDGLIYFTTYDNPDTPGTLRRIEPAQ
ncbi:MAG TPA: PQQ-dependent sugar dehydrogenase [Terriglobia bacterium]|nr:PQQ-dependent sugar dehydrogenase [Terriglobia bacterium]